MIISGSIYNSIKLMGLNMKWQQRQNNPNMPKGDEKESPEIKELRESAERTRKSNIVASIDGKLRAGLELTQEEMEYLRVNHPDKYQEVLEIRQERKAYEKRLRSCKTKEDVAKLNAQKLQNFTAQIKSIQRNPSLSLAEKRQQMDKILKKTMAVQNEHSHFVNSPNYQKLPHEDEIREGKKKEKKHSSEENEQKVDDPSQLSKDFYMQLMNLFDGENIQLKSIAPFDGEGEGKTYSPQGVVSSMEQLIEKPAQSKVKISVKV